VVRLVYGYNQSQNTYYALEIGAGSFRWKRSVGSGQFNNLNDRSSEKNINQDVSANVGVNEWRNVAIWIERSKLSVYLDGQYLFTKTDTQTPAYNSNGKIYLQNLDTVSSYSLTQMRVIRPVVGSTHFDTFPATWTISDNRVVQLQNDGSLRFGGNANAVIQSGDLTDFALMFQLFVEEGKTQIHLRETPKGEKVRLVFNGGNLLIETTDSAGTVLESRSFGNFYGQGRWQPMIIIVRGNTISVNRENQERGQTGIVTLNTMPASGLIRFVSEGRKDYFRVDEVLILGE
jgi:hypothetical protein